MKLTKQQIKQHQGCLRILDKQELTMDERWYVIENWIPGYNTQIALSGTYFTPMGLARDVAVNSGNNNAIDLCAGIGRLGFTHYHYNNKKYPVTCVEINPEFVEVGKKVFPEATWICGDVLDEELIKSLGKFHVVMSNPPFGNVKTGYDSSWLQYKGNEFEYKVVEVGRYLSDDGVFVLRDTRVPFQYSGKQGYRDVNCNYYNQFHKQTGIELEMNSGFDTSSYADQWIGTRQKTEIALVDYSQIA